MKITVVIPAYNEERYIGECLSCLEAQKFPSYQFEVIVVDNGSSDKTVQIVSRFASSFPLQIISRPKISISAVRNAGAYLAKGEIIAFLDADCLPNSEWLSNADRMATRQSIWGAHYLIPPDATWITKVWFTYQAKEREGAVSFIPSSNMFIGRTDFEVLHGFDESVKVSEDVELCARARDLGMSVIAYRSLAVVHEGIPRTLIQFYRQNRWHGQQLLRLFFLNLPSTRNLPIVLASAYTLVMFWMMLAAFIVAFVLHRWLLPVAPISLLLFPSFALSLRKAMKSFSAIPALALLYMVYLLARAAALTHLAPSRIKSWKVASSR